METNLTEVYLDNSATTRCSERAKDLMVKVLMEDYGNPSSLHMKGVEAENYIKEAKKKIAKTLKVDEKEILFTSGGTESNNTALIGAALANKRAGNHIITTSIEHASVSAVTGYLEELGFRVTYLKVDADGIISLDELREAVCEDTILVSMMMVNNEIGAVEPIEEAIKVIKEKNPNTLVHVDAIQAYGKYRIFPKKLGIDMLSVSGHKIHAPKGTGFLFIKDKTKVKPLIYGGGQQKGMRSGTENVPGCAGLGLAAKMVYTDHDAKIDKLLGLTSGVIMIVGPTGSGKSSTMYTLIRELLSDRTNLITLEDPVEYHIDGATQVQINEKVGLTFASGLRSILRQDPDIICVGEIRDGETAEIAMRAAMTGHLVITTVHTEDAISAIDRLRDMGVPPYLIAAGLRGVISQRLLRRICPSCKQETVPSEKSLELAGIPDVPGKIYWHGAGCDQCFRSGYRGRIGVFEVMMVQEELRRCILDGADRKRFMEAAREASGYVTMAEHARKLVDKGITTVDEVIRTLMTL